MLVVRVRYLVCQLFHTLILGCIVGYAGDNDGDGCNGDAANKKQPSPSNGLYFENRRAACQRRQNDEVADTAAKARQASIHAILRQLV